MAIIEQTTAHMALTLEKVIDFLFFFTAIGVLVIVVYTILKVANGEEQVSNKNRVVDNKQAQSSATITTKTLTVNTSEQTQALKKRNQELEQNLAKTREQLEKAQKEKIEQEEKQRKVVLEELAKAESKYKKIWSFDRGE